MIALIGLAVSILLGWTIVDAATRQSRVANATSLKFALAVATGLGCSSLVSFACVVMGAPAAEHPVELLVAAAITAVARRAGRRKSPDLNWETRSLFTALALTVAALAGTATFLADSIRNRYGWFDAWAFWMLRARFLDRLGAAWPAAFAAPHRYSYSHLDYPLLLPSVVATAWRDTASESPELAHLIAALFLLATVALLVSSVHELAGAPAGAAAGIFILSITEMSQVASWLYADVPLACYLLSVVTLVTLAARDERPAGLLFLAGLMAGFAPWTKNDGWAVLAGALVAVAIMRGISPRQKAVAFGSGGLMPLAAVLFFKLRFGGPSDLMRDQRPGSVLSRLSSPGRYWMIARSAGLYFSALWIPLLALAIALALLGMEWRGERARALMPGGAIVITVVTIYGTVYLFTPFDLAWHLNTSLSRLMLQLWPSAAFLLVSLSRHGGESEGAHRVSSGGATPRSPGASDR